MNKASTILRSGDTQAGGENKKENLKFSFDFSETLLTPSSYNPQPVHPGSWRKSFHLPCCPLVCGVEPASRFGALLRGLMSTMYGRAPDMQGACSGRSVLPILLRGSCAHTGSSLCAAGAVLMVPWCWELRLSEGRPGTAKGPLARLLALNGRATVLHPPLTRDFSHFLDGQTL